MQGEAISVFNWKHGDVIYFIHLNMKQYLSVSFWRNDDSWGWRLSLNLLLRKTQKKQSPVRQASTVALLIFHSFSERPFSLSFIIQPCMCVKAFESLSVNGDLPPFIITRTWEMTQHGTTDCTKAENDHWPDTTIDEDLAIIHFTLTFSFSSSYSFIISTAERQNNIMWHSVNPCRAGVDKAG